MARITLTFGDRDYIVEQAEDGTVNISRFAKENPDLRPRGVRKMAIKGWIVANANGLWRVGSSSTTYMVDESVWRLWMGESVGPTASKGSRQGGVDEETRGWISGLFAKMEDKVGSAISTFQDFLAHRFARQEERVDELKATSDKHSDWLYEQDERLNNKADTQRVANLEQWKQITVEDIHRLVAECRNLKEENKTLTARVTILEGKGGGGKGGWFGSR